LRSLKNKITKCRAQLRRHISINRRKILKFKCNLLQREWDHYVERHRRRKVLRQRRRCINNYARYVRRLRNYRQRQLREIRIIDRRRKGINKRLRIFCQTSPKTLCYSKAFSKLQKKKTKN